MTVQPSYGGKAFTCPNCDVHAHMSWSILYEQRTSTSTPFYVANCAHCKASNLWLFNASVKNGLMIFPDKSSVSLPDQDMPEDVLQDYNEAAQIFHRSPRGAAALLRLGLQKLCKNLGQPGKNIDQDIRKLAETNVLPPMVIKVADTVRITGNNAVHPGEMSDEDFDQVAAKLFELLNFIVRKGISEPRELEALYNMTPEGPRKAAEDKDAKARDKKKE